MNFGFNKSEETKKSLELDKVYVDMVREVVKNFPYEFYNGQHFVQLAIYRLYMLKLEEWRSLQKKDVSSSRSQPGDLLPGDRVVLGTMNSVPDNGFSSQPVSSGVPSWQPANSGDAGFRL